MSKFYSEMTPVSPPRIFWPLLSLCIAIAAEIAAVPFSMLISLNSSHWNEASVITVAAPFAALLVGLPTWWFFVIRPRCATMDRGILTGTYVSITAHPLVWISIFTLTPHPSLSFSGTLVSSSPIVQAGMVLLDTLVYSLLSLLYIGWFTILIGGVAGFLLIYLQRALTYHWQRRSPFPKDDTSRL